MQRDCRVIFAGPTTLAALLNSLQMGFRTLAIQKRSSEVWNLLASVKTEFGKFGEALSSVKDKLDQAARHVDSVAVRSRAISKKLRDVEELPSNPQPMLKNLLGERRLGVVERSSDGQDTALRFQYSSTPLLRSAYSTSFHFALSLSMISRSSRIGGVPWFSNSL